MTALKETGNLICRHISAAEGAAHSPLQNHLIDQGSNTKLIVQLEPYPELFTWNYN